MIAQESKKYLNPENRTISTYLLLPLLFNNKDFLYNKYGFINVFLEDINKPWLDNHIFLLYKSSGASQALKEEFKQNSYYYDTYCLKIDNEYYDEYVFIIPSNYRKSIQHYKKSCYNFLTVNDIVKVLKFWGLDDARCIAISLGDELDRMTSVKTEDIIPEEDSLEEFNEKNTNYFLRKLGFEV